MARTNNLSNFLTDVAGAIKEKTGDSTAIPASQFDTKIRSIETGGNYQQKSVTYTSNGTRTVIPDENFDAMSEVEVTVNVETPAPVLQNKTARQNGSYSADPGYDGLGTVLVDVESQTNNQDKTITANGSYTADSGYTGIGTATVNVHEATKVFPSVEQMRLNTDINLNDMAVIYDSTGRQYSLASGEWTYSLYIPETITFPDEIPESGISCGCETLSEDNRSSGSIHIRPEQFHFYIFEDGGELSISYSSEDNITYTCDEVRVENWHGGDGGMSWDSATRIATLGTTKFCYTITNGYADYFTLLFRTIKPEYKGLYKALPEKDITVGGYYAQSATDLLNGDYDEEYTPAYLGISVDTIQSNFSNGAVGLSTGTTNYGGYDDLTFSTVYIANGGMGNSTFYAAIYEDDNTVRLGFYANVRSSNLSAKHTITYKTLSNGEITSVTDSKSINECIYSLISENSYHVFIEMLSVNKNSADIDNLYLLRAYYPRIFTNSGGTISVNDSVYVSTYMQDYLLHNTYQQCPVQFNLSNPNQLLPGIIGYGPNIQVEGDGSIYQNLDPTRIIEDMYGLTKVGGVHYNAMNSDYFTTSKSIYTQSFWKSTDASTEGDSAVCKATTSNLTTQPPTRGYNITIQTGYNLQNGTQLSNGHIVSVQQKYQYVSGSYVYDYIVQIEDENNNIISTPISYTNVYNGAVLSMVENNKLYICDSAESRTSMKLRTITLSDTVSTLQTYTSSGTDLYWYVSSVVEDIFYIQSATGSSHNNKTVNGWIYRPATNRTVKIHTNVSGGVRSNSYKFYSNASYLYLGLTSYSSAMVRAGDTITASKGGIRYDINANTYTPYNLGFADYSSSGNKYDLPEANSDYFFDGYYAIRRNQLTLYSQNTIFVDGEGETVLTNYWWPIKKGDYYYSIRHNSAKHIWWVARGTNLTQTLNDTTVTNTIVLDKIFTIPEYIPVYDSTLDIGFYRQNTYDSQLPNDIGPVITSITITANDTLLYTLTGAYSYSEELRQTFYYDLELEVLENLIEGTVTDYDYSALPNDLHSYVGFIQQSKKETIQSE